MCIFVGGLSAIACVFVCEGLKTGMASANGGVRQAIQGIKPWRTSFSTVRNAHSFLIALRKAIGEIVGISAISALGEIAYAQPMDEAIK